MAKYGLYKKKSPLTTKHKSKEQIKTNTPKNNRELNQNNKTLENLTTPIAQHQDQDISQ